MSLPINSALEIGYQTFLAEQSIANCTGVYRFLPSGSVIVDTPCIFVGAGKSNEVQVSSGIYRIPLEIRIVVMAADLAETSSLLDTMTNRVETALTASLNYINSASADIFIFSNTKPGISLELVEHTYQYTIALENVCKNKG